MIDFSYVEISFFSFLFLTLCPFNSLYLYCRYLPLFELLSVDNILLIFSSLCAERSLCLCSDNIALLTPVSEALLSFLFPFVWQGVYIPVMPTSNLELLEAPIPFIIGTHSTYLRETSPANRPFNLVIVDIDNDKILQGIDNKAIDCYLPAQASKLRTKLQVFGGSAYHRNHEKIINNVGLSFLKSEHLTPIVHFAAVDGVNSKLDSERRSSDSGGHNRSAFSHLLKNSSKSYDMTPLLCTKTSKPNRDIVLDPVNNVLGEGDAAGSMGVFNANEIRQAFLRFFVSVLMNYQHFVVKSSSAVTTTEKQPGVGPKATGTSATGSTLSSVLSMSLSSNRESPNRNELPPRASTSSATSSSFLSSLSRQSSSSVLSSSGNGNGSVYGGNGSVYGGSSISGSGTSVTGEGFYTSPIFNGDEYLHSHDDLFLRRMLVSFS